MTTRDNSCDLAGPEERPRWLPWAVGLIVLQLVILALQFR